MDELPVGSVALNVLVVVPTGKEAPLPRPVVCKTELMPQLSVAVGEAYVVTEKQKPGSLFLTMLGGQVMVGAVASFTVTVKEQVFELPTPSVAR